ncbi:MAG: chemotaxis response regulator protein-glutamate methylesterase [Spirochaetes bacterium]|jgi:two-component system chemotaxis response regulator CheB|nr:chemotaxis response regulator protein-glutamate methylesterase [Spirochaetota bacterium]
MADQIKVLVVDDSSLVRKITTDILESDPMIKVIGTANNGKTAIFKNTKLNPDVITMDIEMPIMDGLAALRYIIETNPKPVIMMSVLTQHGAEATFKALEYGAVDFIPKPSSLLSLTLEEIGSLLISKVKSVYHSKISTSRKSSGDGSGDPRSPLEKRLKMFDKGETSSKIIGIGTSTGGPSALINIFESMPANFPSPVVVVQHMPEGFTKAFSERLDSSSQLRVKEAEDGDPVNPGWGYIAPGHSHIRVENRSNVKYIRVFKGDKVSGHMPSIDVLFNSLAEECGDNTIGVIMTGMGKDGAEGILKIKKSGGRTIAQDENTSVVYGMNRVAVQLGAIDEVLPLYEIPKKIVEYI